MKFLNLKFNSTTKRRNQSTSTPISKRRIPSAKKTSFNSVITSTKLRSNSLPTWKRTSI